MRCQNGYNQCPSKSGNCIKKPEILERKVLEKKKRKTSEKKKSPVSRKNKKCPKGTRKNKAGVCIPKSVNDAIKKSVDNTIPKSNSVDDAIKKWLNELGDDEFFSADEIAEIKRNARKQNLTGTEVYNNLDDYAKGTGILVDY